jgi:hypothetical protein
MEPFPAIHGAVPATPYSNQGSAGKASPYFLAIWFYDISNY